MALRKKYSKKNKKIKNRAHFVLPLVLLFCATLLMILPLEGPVSSVKALLSYVFIPQIRAAHHAVEYSSDVWDTVVELLNTHQENKHLQEELRQIQLEGAQAKEIAQENQRLSAALKLQGQLPWSGVWAKTTYRDPSQWNSIMIDKGSLDGVRERSAAIAQKNGQPVLAGVVLETTELAAKVLLLRDEDFSAAVYVAPSGDEGLLGGAGSADLKIQYLPLLSTVKEGDLVYTSSSSSIFPAGILIGRVSQVEGKKEIQSSLVARVEPMAEAGSIRELFILTATREP